MPAAERIWIIHTNHNSASRDAKIILPRNIAQHQTKSGKSPNKSVRPLQRDHLAQPTRSRATRGMKSCGIPWGKSSLQHFRKTSVNRTWVDPPPSTEPCLTFVPNTEQHASTTVYASCPLVLTCLSAWNHPVRFSCQWVLTASLCWLSAAPAQSSLNLFWEDRRQMSWVMTLRPLWASRFAAVLVPKGKGKGW